MRVPAFSLVRPAFLAAICLLLAATSAHADEDGLSIKDGLLAYYTFEDGARDSSPNHFDAELTPAVRFDQGTVGKAAYLSQSNARLKLPAMGVVDPWKGTPDFAESSVTGYSVSGWIKTNGRSGGYWGGERAFANVSIAWDTQQVIFDYPVAYEARENGMLGIYHRMFQVRGVKSIPKGIWTHVAVTFTPDGYLRIYIDGVEDLKLYYRKIWTGYDFASRWMSLMPGLPDPHNLSLQSPTLHCYLDDDPRADECTLNGGIDQVMLHNRALRPYEVKLLANRGNHLVPEYVVKFAPELRMTRNARDQGYPMSAQPFFDRLPKDAAGVPIAMGGSGALGTENTDPATLKNGSIPTYYQESRLGNQIRINYWWFYGYQHSCFLGLGAHNGDWEHVMVILKEGQSGVAAVMYFQHDGHYLRVAVNRDAPCTPGGTGRCGGSSGFELNGTHPVVYAGLIAHGSYHDRKDERALAGLECAYWGDMRSPDGDKDALRTWENLVNLDGDAEPWIAKDRVGSWAWGPDGVSAHPTQKSPLTDEARVACVGAPTFLVESDGCYMSECLAGDDQASEDCLKTCRHGFTNVGLTCNKGFWPWEWEIYGRLTGGNKYSYNYTIPTTDVGLSRLRVDDSEWDLP